ncbi:MAG TPA: DNA double-strand break repair nuclease NurA [Solirubrobacteraceae bacterium]|jgi:hypothetical protein
MSAQGVQDSLFEDLPAALLRDLLQTAAPVADRVHARIDALRTRSEELRAAARAADLIRRKADLERPREPSVAGIDGSYQIRNLTSLDLCAAAAVAVEGTSKEAKRYWPEPRHRMWTDGVPHGEAPVGVLRALMVAMELELAAESPHDLVLLDGAFASLIIYLNQGLSSIGAVAPALASELRDRWEQGGLFEQLISLLTSKRVVAMPKFTERNELCAPGRLPQDVEVDGRTLATIVLAPGEYTAPLPTHVQHKGPNVGQPQDYHLPEAFCDSEQDKRMNAALQGVRVIYFRPYPWVPALRIELPGPVANNPVQLSIGLEGIERQFFTSAVVEPYPLFLADRMVKSLGAGMKVVEQAVAQQVAGAGGDVELSILFLQHHRTEGGRG